MNRSTRGPAWGLTLAKVGAGVATCAVVNVVVNLAIGDGLAIATGFALGNMLEVLAALATMRAVGMACCRRK